MELSEAASKAFQILGEERKYPTVKYKDLLASPGDSASSVAAAVIYLHLLRSERPRELLEETKRFQFESTNYNLLRSIFLQLRSESRPEFIASILRRLGTTPACAKTKKDSFPVWNGLVSDLPLVAAFALRSGGAEAFFQALSEADPLVVGILILLKHLEDMVALDFTAIPEAGYKKLSISLTKFRETARRKLAEFQLSRTWTVKFPEIGEIRIFGALQDMIATADAIREECRKALYLYLKASLLEGLNIEINQDKDEVESTLKKLGFSATLIGSLNEADRLYRGGTTGFDLKSGMGHLRSFLENLHSEAIAKIKSSDPPKKWGEGRSFLTDQGVLSKRQEDFVGSLYTLISDEAVHPLIAEREYARLARNMVVEYGLLFLRILEKKGLKKP